MRAACPGSAIGRSRLEGYERALREAGLRPLQEDVLETGFGQEDGYRAGCCFFAALRRPPTAICCANDLIALGVVQALRERGLRVPQDVSVTGMDDIPYAALSSPRLTTVTNDSGVFAREGVRMLFERIDGRYDGPAREASVAHALVVRDSTASAGPAVTLEAQGRGFAAHECSKCLRGKQPWPYPRTMWSAAMPAGWARSPACAWARRSRAGRTRRIRRVLGEEVWGYIVDYDEFAADDDTNGPLFFQRALRTTPAPRR